MARKRHPITGCRAESLMGDWLIDAATLEKLRAEAATYNLVELAKVKSSGDDEEEESECGYAMDAAYPGVGVITMSGPTSKYPTSFSRVMGGGSTVQAAKSLRDAVKDPNVKSIMMRFEDVPGGTLAGSREMVTAIRKADGVKPVFTHVDDQGTSGGQMYAAQGRRSTANHTALLGSIGVVSRLIDSSKNFEAEGIKVIPIASGTLKAAGMPGVKITDEQIKAAKDLTNRFAQDFAQIMVASPRKFKTGALERLVKTAEIVHSETAVEDGLIDAICSFEEAMEYATNYKPGQEAPRTASDPDISKGTEKAGSPARKTAMLTTAQLAQLQALPGGAELSAEATVEQVLAVAVKADAEAKQLRAAGTDAAEDLAEARREVTRLEASAKLPVIDAKLAWGHVDLAARSIDMMEREGTMLPSQTAVLKPYIVADAAATKAVEGCVKPDGTVMLPFAAVEKVLHLNQPTGVVKTLAGTQPAPRTEPGATDKSVRPTLVEANAYRIKNGLPAWTQAEYDTQVAAGRI